MNPAPTPTPPVTVRRTRPATGARSARWPLWLTDRDRWILAAVAENQILTSDHLTALAFTTRRSAQRRLARLTDAGYLERFRPPRTLGSAPAHYLITPHGADLLTDPTDPRPTGRARGRDAAPGPPRSFLRLAHTLGVADLYVALATAGPPGPQTGLRRWWGERTCTAWWGTYARPDAYGRWHGTDTHRRARILDFFLEYDTGSENLTRLITKLHGYRQLADATGITTTTVLFQLPSPAREHGLHTRLALAGEDPLGVPVATTTATTDLTGRCWLPATTTSSGPHDRRTLTDLGSPHPHHPPRLAEPEPAGGPTGPGHPLPWPPPPPLPPAAPEPPATPLTRSTTPTPR